jgi:hypothetical protein
MTDREDRFATDLDALSRGEAPYTHDDLIRFAAEAFAVSTHDQAMLPPASPPHLAASDRRDLWDAIRQEAATSRTSHAGSPVMSPTALATPVTTPQASGWGATVVRWQPVLSVTVMFALLLGLIGVAYTGLHRRASEPEPAMLSALQDDATPATGIECDEYGSPVRSSSELRDMSPSDWPAREYMPEAAADPDIALRAVEAYEHWVMCAWAMGNEAVALPPGEILRFWSDRMQYQFMLQRGQSFASEEQAELLQQPSIEALVQHGTLLLNRPLVDIVNPVTGERLPSFESGDVYALTDGRYGVVIGSISTEQLVGSGSTSPDNEEGISLTFLAFVESDGYLLIDEYTSFCVVPPVMPFTGTADLAACADTLGGVDG